MVKALHHSHKLYFPLDKPETLEFDSGISVNYLSVKAADGGLKKNGKEGWFLLRMSLHDPVMPLNVESSDEGGTDMALAEIYSFMEGYDGIERP